MKLIPLTQGKFAQVDDDDFERVSQFKWGLADYSKKRCKNGTQYAHRTVRLNGKKTTQRMHQFIMGTGSVWIDHKDGNGLNNQKANLRQSSRYQNLQNQKVREHSSRFKGVTWCSKTKKWRARIHAFGKAMNIGFFSAERDAALAYDSAAIRHFGPFARTNQQMEVYLGL